MVRDLAQPYLIKGVGYLRQVRTYGTMISLSSLADF